MRGTKLTVKELAQELEVKDLDVRKAARKLYGKATGEKGQWSFNKQQADHIRRYLKVGNTTVRKVRSNKQQAEVIPEINLDEVSNIIGGEGKRWVLVELPQ